MGAVPGIALGREEPGAPGRGRDLPRGARRREPRELRGLGRERLARWIREMVRRGLRAGQERAGRKPALRGKK